MADENKNVVINVNQKSVGLAFILTFLFGGLGMFYVSILSGIIWSIIELFVGIATAGIGLFVLHPLMIIISIIAVKNQNKKKQKKMEKKLNND